MQKLRDKITDAIQKVLGPNEPALVGGVIGVAVAAVILALTGAFSDGVQATELGFMLGPLGISIPIRQGVYSPRSAGHAPPHGVHKI